MFGLSSKNGYTVMVLEDNLTSLTLITKVLPSLVSGTRVLEARSIAAARRSLAKEKVDFFVLDIHLPDGNGLDFLAEVQAKNPGARVVVNTAVPLPQYRSRAGELGALRFLEKPVPPRKLAALIQEHIEARRNPAPSVAAPATGFSASLSALTPMDIIQLKCLGKRNQTLEFFSEGERGSIVFEDGEIVHAETGRLQGVPALARIVGWPGGRVEELTKPASFTATIHERWQSLLLSVAQTADEERQPAVA